MKKFLFVILVVSIFSCSKDDSKSSEAELISMKVSPVENFTPSTIFNDITNSQLYIFTDSDTVIDNYPVTLAPEIQVSPGATISPVSGTTISFQGPEEAVKYTITSEDEENIVEYYVTLRDFQIPNSDFENWHEKTGVNSKSFSDPGKYEESTVWATANMGTSIYGSYGTTPLAEGQNTLVQIKTIISGVVPVASGTLFLGKFDFQSVINNPTNPKAATKVGIPFIHRPTAVKFKYKYQSGAQMIQATLKDPGNLMGGFTVEEISGKDEFSIAIVLENRLNDNTLIIAEVNYISGTETIDLTELTIPIDYSSSENPTHFYVVFGSSANGHNYKGAVGSTLIIDDFELVYE